MNFSGEELVEGLLHFYIVKAVPMNRNSLGAMGVEMELGNSGVNSRVSDQISFSRVSLFFSFERSNLLHYFSCSHSIRAVWWLTLSGVLTPVSSWCAGAAEP